MTGSQNAQAPRQQQDHFWCGRAAWLGVCIFEQGLRWAKSAGSGGEFVQLSLATSEQGSGTVRAIAMRMRRAGCMSGVGALLGAAATFVAHFCSFLLALVTGLKSGTAVC